MEVALYVRASTDRQEHQQTVSHNSTTCERMG